LKAPGASLGGGLALFLGVAGCQLDPAAVHPRFAELEPQAIAVMPVENRTVLDLARVTSAGPLQRLTIGGREVDVPATLRDGMAEALLRKGYRIHPGGPAGEVADYRRPLPSGAAPGFDGVLYSEITTWRLSGAYTGGEIEVGGGVELVRVGDQAHGGGEVLYRSPIGYRSGSAASTRTPVDLEEEVRRAGRAALRGLPSPTPPVPGGAKDGQPGGKGDGASPQEGRH
jgi:hypothetical protein